MDASCTEDEADAAAAAVVVVDGDAGYGFCSHILLPTLKGGE